MKKTLDSGPQKIQKICDMVKSDALEPAKKEAEALLLEARKLASEIISDAEREAKVLSEKSKKDIEQQRVVFHSMLQQAAKLSFSELKKEIENNLFGAEIQKLVTQGTQDIPLVAKLIDATLQAITKEGISADISAYIAKSLSPEAVNQILGQSLLSKLRDKEVKVDNFGGGAKIKLHDKKITLDLSDEALSELMERYAPSFRKFLFAK